MRLGVWNLDTVDRPDRVHFVRTVLQSHHADVWVLTETHDDMCPALRHQPAHADQQDVRIAPTRLRRGSRWVSIWSAWGIAAQLKTTDPQRTVAARLGSPEGERIIYGVVLPWPNSRPSFEDMVETLKGDWLQIKEQHPDTPLIVAGDFNCDMDRGQHFPGAEAMDSLNAALLACGLECPTRPAQFPVGWLEQKLIDHVLAPASWARRAKIVDAWEGKLPCGVLSDHSGFVIDLAGG